MMRGRISWIAMASALAILCWLGLAWAVEVKVFGARSLGATLFRVQDMPALLLGGCALAATGLFAGGAGHFSWAWARDRRAVLPAILVFAVIAWTGHYWLFDDYAISRDEQVAEFAAAALRHGWLGWPIPPEWVDYRRAIMPEFFSSFGADRFWTAAYLPLNSAFRAFWGFLSDADLAGPVFLVIGLVALWRVALRLFPDRPDAVAVAMLMALSSVQLLVTGMTPYAMTGHFALNMVWLALVLRGGAWGHGGAGLVALLLAGLHQYHYPLPFLVPFLLWFALGRRWRALAFHAAVLALVVILWAKLWPSLLIDLHGPAADVRPSAGVADKMGSLVGRLPDKWHPLLHLSRFLAWNNLLLVPLALAGLFRMNWRAALRGERVAVPLALGAFGMAVLAIDQGYGWGYRYLHGFIGPLALLAGYGWTSLKRPRGEARASLLGASLLVAMLTGSFLMMRAHDYVAPYAAAYRLMMSNDADIVLVDPRGGRYTTDLVRGRDDEPLGRPVVLDMERVSPKALDRLCDRYSVAILDKSSFLPLGVGAVNWNNDRIAANRTHLTERGCGRTIVVPGQ